MQDEAMAEWLAAHLPEITQEFMGRDATPGVEARSKPRRHDVLSEGFFAFRPAERCWWSQQRQNS